jgi:APA family basic amino acid/polyamine antiporter
VGWSGYLTVILHGLGIHLPVAITNAPGSVPGAIINLPALLIVLLITYVLYIGISESARINSIIVGIKLVVIGAVIVVGAFFVRPLNWSPFAPMGWPGVMKSSNPIATYRSASSARCSSAPCSTSWSRAC